MEPLHISSRDNAQYKELRKLTQDPGAYRRQGRIWLEGDHLCRAALARGWRPALGLFAESFWPLAPADLAHCAIKNIAVSDPLWQGLSALESPARMGFVLDLPPAETLAPGVSTVVLDRVQDTGNVGSILRSAAAFGFTQIAAIKGSASVWSPKVLRAGMGAHFGLRLVESVEPDSIAELGLPVLVTSSHHGEHLHRQSLPWPCVWVMGHEGQGVGATLQSLASRAVRIAQPGGEESLNVAAAAAICLHASAAARS